MKKVLLYIMLVIMIVGNTSFGQLCKVHFLFRHFHEHQLRDSSISLIDFLRMHYWGTDLPDHDEEQDNQLPFKHVAHHLHFDFFPPVEPAPLLPPVLYYSIVYGWPRHCYLPEASPHDLLRPPRLYPIA